jgi:hypothetical protein
MALGLSRTLPAGTDSRGRWGSCWLLAGDDRHVPAAVRSINPKNHSRDLGKHGKVS